MIDFLNILGLDDPDFVIQGVNNGLTVRELNHDQLTRKGDDPLDGLYQIDQEQCNPLEEEALVLMARMLDDVEKFGEFTSDLRSIMEEDKLVETRILSLLSTLIDGVKLEHKYLKINTLF